MSMEQAVQLKNQVIEISKVLQEHYSDLNVEQKDEVLDTLSDNLQYYIENSLERNFNELTEEMEKLDPKFKSLRADTVLSGYIRMMERKLDSVQEEMGKHHFSFAMNILSWAIQDFRTFNR